MSTGEILGWVAGAIVTLSFIPQLTRVFKLKSAHEISLLFTTLLLAGILIWLAYGIYFRLWPVVIWNIIGAAEAIALLYAKLKYGK